MWASVRRFVMYALPLILLAGVVMLPMDLRPDDFRTFGGILERAGLTCLVCGGGYLAEVRQRPINWVTTIGTMLIFLPLLVYG